jgi:ABC-type branched-subunit amino acid transport system ATPase component/branched-subunit amino acid ABC-type transport system permease component
VNVLPFVITGLVTGAVYGLAGVGLVLTYKTSGVFNFAHGALAAVAAYAFYSLHVTAHVSLPLAAAIAVLVVGPVMGLLFERLARAISTASLAVRVAGTVGVLLIVQAAVVLVYGQLETRIVPPFLGTGQWDVGGTAVQVSDVVTFAVAALATAVLYVFLRGARLGVAMRAVVDDPDLVELAGTSALGVRRWAWLIGVAFAAASGVLLAPLLPLDPVLLTLLVVQAFGAAAIGAFTSLPLTFAGGLVLGVLASLATRYSTDGLLAGVPPSLPFIVLLAVLLALPRRFAVERTPAVPPWRSPWRAPAAIQVATGAALLALLLWVPSFAGLHLRDWAVALGTVIAFLSLGLLVRTAGLVSLCHVGFAAIGAAAFSHLTLGAANLPWTVALLAAGLVVVPVGAVLAIAAIRLPGLYFSIATFGFGVLLLYGFYTQDFMFGSTGSGLTMPQPVDSEEGVYYVVLLAAIVAVALMLALDRSRLGRLLRGIADTPRAVAISGAAVGVTRALVCCLCVFLAGIAGALTGVAQQTVSVDFYQPLQSLTYVALIMIVPGGLPWYAVLAAGGLVLVPSYVTTTTANTWLQLVFGVSAVLFALMPDAARGVPERLRGALDARLRRRETPVARGAPGARAPGRVAAGRLEIDDVTVRFGGLVAVDGVSLAASTGTITGIVGPNGAGKTVLFNVCSGLQRPDRGRVVLDGQDVTRTAPWARARRGLGRTFQELALFESLNVWDNVAVGGEAPLAGGNPLRHLVATPAEKRAVADATVRALSLCGLATTAGTAAGVLPTGRRRLVELARCLAGPYKILLLDEPSSGLDRAETARFGQLLGRVVGERGVGVLLVEHDMSLVMDVCDRIHVLELGRMIFEGTPQEALASPIVRAAYLGGEQVEAT